MGLRFRKSFGLGTLARLNFSLSGPSLSLGPRGASITVGRRGVHANVGLPGTGISWRERLDRNVVPRRPLIQPPDDPDEEGERVRWMEWLRLVPVIILLLAIAATLPVLKESWDLGGPGARHAADVHPLVRGGWGR